MNMSFLWFRQGLLLSDAAAAELPTLIQQGFERRALVPRLGVVVLLFLGALTDYGHGPRTVHWIVLLAYAVVTVVAAAGTCTRSARVQAWLPLATTCVDAVIAVYVIAEHVPRHVADTHLATESFSLLPALLFVLQTGMRLRPRLTAVFALLVGAGWISTIAILSNTVGFGVGSIDLFVQQAMNFVAFMAASGFVFATTVWMRHATASALRAQEEHVILSRFLPAGVVDKYVGDGVLALFLGGDQAEQAAKALSAVEAAFKNLATLNDERGHAALPPLRIIAALHCGPVLAGVFDDGRRAEFTVLGPVMNDLSRIERRAKAEDRDVVASADLLRWLARTELDRVGTLALAARQPTLPRLFVLFPGVDLGHSCPVHGL
ncbi:hypothetical protein ADL19_03990 [Streptomyces purpurogeneiscleroticus]|nr:hypothetical protein ADL19_03990 [Streptomyces purpurogeneiscleroticus]